MTRNQRIAIELLGMIRKGTEIHVDYGCLDDMVSLWCYKNSDVNVVHIFNHTPEKQSICLFNECKAIIESQKSDAEITRNQKLAIKLMHEIKSGMDIVIRYDCYIDQAEFCHGFLSDQLDMIDIREYHINEQANNDFKKCLKIIEDVQKVGFGQPAFIF